MHVLIKNNPKYEKIKAKRNGRIIDTYIVIKSNGLIDEIKKLPPQNTMLLFHRLISIFKILSSINLYAKFRFYNLYEYKHNYIDHILYFLTTMRYLNNKSHLFNKTFR